MQKFVQDVSMLMDSADLYLTKPGGISGTEASKKRLPMVFVDAVAGCEEYNLQYFVERGAAVTAEEPPELADKCLELLQSEEALSLMAGSFGVLASLNAAYTICRALAAEPQTAP